MKAMRRITVVPDHGYHVRIYGPNPVSQYFSIKALGRKEAKAAAQKWRDEQETALGISANDYGTNRPRTHHSNSKGTPGVFVSIGEKNGRFYGDVMAVLNYQDEEGKSKRMQRTFSILKYGYHAAYVMALGKRCEMAKLDYPETFDVPPLSAEHIELLVTQGATTKTLTESTLVPWTGKRV